MAHRYYCPPQQVFASEGRLTLVGDEAAHLARVMRARPGQAVTVFDGLGTRYACEITAASPEQVDCSILSAAPGAAEPSVAVTLYVGYPKGDKLELIIQKAVELGAARIVPFFSRFCVVTPKKEEQKNQRYNRIALEAAKQSGRDLVPGVAMPLSFEELLKELPGYDAALFCYEAEAGAPRLADRLKAAKSVAIVTGSEGGFAPAEAAAAAAVAHSISLGPRILRCETAPIAALAAVMILTGNLE